MSGLLLRTIWFLYLRNNPAVELMVLVAAIWKIKVIILYTFIHKNANCIVNIIEKLSGSGRHDNCNPIPGVTVERQKKETKWMFTLQTVYPYGLNDRVGDEYMAEKDSRVVGNKFLPLHGLYKRPEYNYSKNKLDNSFLKKNFVKILTTHLDHNLKDAGYFIRVSIKSFKKSFLKHICNDVYDFLRSKADSFPNQQ